MGIQADEGALARSSTSIPLVVTAMRQEKGNKRLLQNKRREEDPKLPSLMSGVAETRCARPGPAANQPATTQPAWQRQRPKTKGKDEAVRLNGV